jgi:nucleotide-binding universal stress UspA family protein
MMVTQKLLVPLDGSTLAESVLAEAAVLGKALAAEVIFLQVILPIDDVIRSGPMTISVDEVWATQREQALRYLNEVRTRPQWTGVKTDIAVELGQPAETILDVARARGVDRIVMATHGRTGITRWVFGSVAEKILQAADRTVVLVRARSPIA